MWARQSGIFSEKGLRLMGSQRLTFFSWWVSCDPESLSWEGLNQQLSLDIISFSDGAVRSRINMFTTQSSLGFICLHKANLRSFLLLWAHLILEAGHREHQWRKVLKKTTRNQNFGSDRACQISHSNFCPTPWRQQTRHTHTRVLLANGQASKSKCYEPTMQKPCANCRSEHWKNNRNLETETTWTLEIFFPLLPI